MPVAVLHDEFTPYGGRGGVCATGEIIVGPGVGAPAYALDMFVVFDPVSKSASTASVSIGGSVSSVSHGCPWGDGVAVAAYNGSANTMVVYFPDHTYDVMAAPPSFTGIAGDWSTSSDGSSLLFVRSDSTTSPHLFTPGVGWTVGPGTSLRVVTQPQMFGGVMYGMSHAGDLVSINMSSGAITVVHSSVGVPASSTSRQAVVLGGRLWFSTSSTNLRGVRVSDGDVVDITVPSHSPGRLTTDGTHLFTISTGAAVYQIHPITFNVVVHTILTSLVAVYSMFFSGGKVWVPGSHPIS